MLAKKILIFLLAATITTPVMAEEFSFPDGTSAVVEDVVTPKANTNEKADITEKQDKEENKKSSKKKKESEKKSNETTDEEDEITKILATELEKPDLNRGFPFYSNPKKPAPMGIWLKAYRLSYSDSDDHVVYFRVTNISDTEVTAADIKAFNERSKNGIIGELTDPYLEYKEIEYDVYYPEDFYVGDDGYVIDPTLAFSISNPDGGGFVTERGIYVGLSKVQPLDIFDTGSVSVQKNEETGEEETVDSRIKPGDVFHGKSVFVMLSGRNDYVLEYACRQSEPDGQVIYQYTKCTK